MRGGRVVDEDGKEIPGGGKGYRYVFFWWADLLWQKPLRNKDGGMIAYSLLLLLQLLDILVERGNYPGLKSCSKLRPDRRQNLPDHLYLSYAATLTLHTMVTILTKRMEHC